MYVQCEMRLMLQKLGCGDMIVTIHTQTLDTQAQVQGFVSNNEAIWSPLTDRAAAYGWMTDTLKLFRFS